MNGLIKRFRRDDRGVSAVEFALIAPVMITFYFGMVETTQALLADRRAGHVASAVGDLVAQSKAVSSADLTDIFAIGNTIMSPYSTTTLKMRVSSVTVNSSGVAKVDWSSGQGMTALAAASTVTLPSGVASNGQSIIMSEVSYDYDSPIDYFMPNGLTFTRKFYLRPRKSDSVTKTS